MTDVRATSPHCIQHHKANGVAGTSVPEAQDARSFADGLLDWAGRDRASANDDQRPFGGGTMRSTVEAFDAQGLLDGTAPVSAGAAAHGATDGEQGQPALTPPPVLPIFPAEPTTHMGPTTPVAAGMGAKDASAPVDAPTGVGLRASDPPLAAAATPLPAGAPPALLPASLPAQSSRPAVTAKAASPARPLPPRVPADRAASTLKVALDIGDNGVAVSVIGDPLDASESPALYHAVARLLARHGLVLSELRVARRPWAGGRQQEER